MKLLFLTLLLANALVFAWNQWLAAPTPPAPPAVASIPTLTLASEMAPPARETIMVPEEPPEVDVAEPVAGPVAAADGSPAAATGAIAAEDQAQPDVSAIPAEPAPQAAAATAADDDTRVAIVTDTALATDAYTCLSLGPFREQDDAGNAVAQLASEGLQPRQRSAEGIVGGGYWVHLPPYPTRAEASQAVAQINERGVPDAYIVRTGEDTNAIALGMLTEWTRAQRLAAEVRDIGFDAQIAERTLTDTVYWVDVDVNDATLIDPMSFQTSPRRIARLRVEPCPTPGPEPLD